MKTIKELLSLPEGTAVDAVTATLKGLGEYSSGNTGGVAFSLQGILLEDKTGEIRTKVSTQPKFTEDMIGQSFGFASQNKNGKLYGLKMGNDDGIILLISKNAVITPVESEPEAPPPVEQEPTPEEVEAATPEPPKEAKTEPAPAKAGLGMRVTEFRYERTFNTGNYTSEKIGLTLALEEGTQAKDALARAKAFMEKYGPKDAVPHGRPLA